MFWQARLRQHPAFMDGLRALLPQAPGIAAWGMMTGVAMVKSGLSVFEAVAMTIFVFAGSAQLAATPLIIAGAPIWVILATAFCVNLRFVVFSLHLRDYLMHLPRWRRLAMGYFTTDMNYVFLTRRHPHPGREAASRLAQEAYLAGSSGINWVAWIVPSVAGSVLANFIPQQWGLGFAGILCLVGIMCSLATTRLRMVAMVVAGAVGVAAYTLPLKLNIVLAISAAVFGCLLLEQRAVREGQR